MYYIKRLYIFFSTLALIIFFFSTDVVKAKSFEINDIEISQPFEINFDKNRVIDLGFKDAFFELIYSLLIPTKKILINLGNFNRLFDLNSYRMLNH